jgi:hypothetical protein
LAHLESSLLEAPSPYSYINTTTLVCVHIGFVVKALCSVKLHIDLCTLYSTSPWIRKTPMKLFDMSKLFGFKMNYVLSTIMVGWLATQGGLVSSSSSFMASSPSKNLLLKLCPHPPRARGHIFTTQKLQALWKRKINENQTMWSRIFWHHKKLTPIPIISTFRGVIFIFIFKIDVFKTSFFCNLIEFSMTKIT